MRDSGSKERNAQTARAKTRTKYGYEPRFASEDHGKAYNRCTGQGPDQVPAHEVGYD